MYRLAIASPPAAAASRGSVEPMTALPRADARAAASSILGLSTTLLPGGFLPGSFLCRTLCRIPGRLFACFFRRLLACFLRGLFPGRRFLWSFLDGLFGGLLGCSRVGLRSRNLCGFLCL